MVTFGYLEINKYHVFGHNAPCFFLTRAAFTFKFYFTGKKNKKCCCFKYLSTVNLDV